jgi:putative acetyltransferase
MSQLESAPNLAVTITRERPDTPEAIALIDELEATLAPHYPPTSRHGYDVQKLIDQGVAFFVIRHGGAPAGCGGVQLFGTAYGELKRMYVRPQFRGLGLAKLLIDRLAAHALASGAPLLRLETGIHQHEAVGLYERAGFARVPPFGEYHDDPLSIFFEKRIG